MREQLKQLLLQLSNTNKEVYTLTVEDNDETLYGFFRKPTFSEFRMIYPLIQKGDDLMADKRLLETCWLGGDPQILDVENNLDIFISIKSELSKLVQIKEASLKKN